MALDWVARRRSLQRRGRSGFAPDSLFIGPLNPKEPITNTTTRQYTPGRRSVNPPSHSANPRPLLTISDGGDALD
jgi:hypothetical protein